MKQYSIGAIAKLTGLTVHNLRVWEKRHNAVSTSRTESGRRIYDDAALTRLKLLKRCVDNGFAIGTIAKLTNTELEEMLAEAKSQTTAMKPAPPANLQVLTVGNEPARLLMQMNADTLANINTKPLENLTELEQQANRYHDLAIIEQASLSTSETQQLARLIKNINVAQIWVFYRYCRKQDVSYLKSLGVKTMKSPVDKNSLQSLFDVIRHRPQSDSVIPKTQQAPARLFSNQELHNAANISTSIDCECPLHLAELIKSLTAFEQYSAHCEKTEKAQTDLHQHIFIRTSQARLILEELLETVLQHEGIELRTLDIISR